MGEVFRAHDPRLRRDVAVKTSLQRFDERFEREARAIAALNHPNICQIYDVGPDYLVMELVEGSTLQERIRQGPIPVSEALRIAGQIGEALAAAHEKHITHRDLKPGNIKLKDNGEVKVLDFGLAKFGGASAAADSEATSTFAMPLTQTGAILGTAAYMSPEQSSGKAVDARSDIWAFGVVLYEMVTGRRPFRGETFVETLASVVRDTPDLSAAPREVRRLLEACLQKDPAHRLQAIGDRHLLLLEPARPRFRWLWPAIACAASLGAAALVLVRYRETPPALPSLRYHLTRSPDSAFGEFQLSPDGRYLAFAPKSAPGRLFIRALDSLEDREVPGTDGTTYPFWSPDSTHVAFFSQGKLKQVALSGGPATDIIAAPDARGGTWVLDGTIVFAPGVTGTLSRVSASGGAATPMKLPRAGSNEGDSLRFPTFLPDSDRFFYTIEAPTREGAGIYVGSLAGDPPVRVLPELSIAGYVPSRRSEAGGFILFRRQATLMAQAFDARKLKTRGEAFPLAEGIQASGNTGFADFTVSANGLLLYAASGNSDQERELVWLDRAGKRGTAILKQKGIADFALSPDEKQILYSFANQVVPGDLWLHNIASGVSQRFARGPFSVYGPVWSPDSSAAVFTAYPEDRLYERNLASGKEEPLPVAGTNTYASSWSAVDKQLAFTQMGVTTKDDLWLLPLEGNRKSTLFRNGPYAERSGQISPDGRWMLFSSDPSDQMEIFIASTAPGATPRQISVDGGTSPRWRADGRELYFISRDLRVMAVEVTASPELKFGAPQKLFQEPTLVTDGQGIAYQPSRDGTKFLVLRPVGSAPAALPLTVVTNWQAALKK
jgi:serine/threonine protein kinase